MKKILILLLGGGVLLVYGITFSHPGNTSYDGCHYCKTNCTRWGYTYGTRHCHNGGFPQFGPADPLHYGSYSSTSSKTAKKITVSTTSSQLSTQKNKECSIKYPGTVWREKDDMCICPVGNAMGWNKETQSCSEKKQITDEKKSDVKSINFSYYQIDKNKHCDINWPGTIYLEKNDFCGCENGKFYKNGCDYQEESFNDIEKVLLEKKQKELKGKECITPHKSKIIKNGQKVKGVFNLFIKELNTCTDTVAIMLCKDGEFQITEKSKYKHCEK